MAKKLIDYTPELLVKKRKKYRRNNVIGSILMFFLLPVLAFIYVFLYAGYHGYAGKEGLDWMVKNLSFLKSLPYFKTDVSIIAIFQGTSAAEYFKGDTLYRFIILVSVIVLAFVVSILYGVLHGRKLNKKYQKLYVKVIQNKISEHKCELVVHGKKDRSIITSDAVKEDLKLAGTVDSTALSSITGGDDSLTWDGVQVEYTYNNKKRNGFLLTTNLESSKINGFLQLRNYGRSLVSDYKGENLEKYGFADNNLLSRFICYSTLDQRIYRVIDLELAQNIFNMQHFLSSSIVVTLSDDRYTVFIDGFKLNLIRQLKEKVTAEFISEQALALVALHQVYSNVGKLLVNDNSLLIDEIER